MGMSVRVRFVTGMFMLMRPMGFRVFMTMHVRVPAMGMVVVVFVGMRMFVLMRMVVRVGLFFMRMFVRVSGGVFVSVGVLVWMFAFHGFSSLALC